MGNLDSKRYKTAAILFAIGGILFIIVGAVSRKIEIFLPVGIALIILSLNFWQYVKKLTNSEQTNSPE